MASYPPQTSTHSSGNVRFFLFVDEKGIVLTGPKNDVRSVWDSRRTER